MKQKDRTFEAHHKVFYDLKGQIFTLFLEQPNEHRVSGGVHVAIVVGD